MDPKKRYPGRSVAETGKYNLHVIFSAEEHRALEQLSSLTDFPKAEIVRRLVMGSANALGIPIPNPEAPPRMKPRGPQAKNGKKHPPSPALASTSGTFAACSSSSS